MSLTMLKALFEQLKTQIKSRTTSAEPESKPASNLGAVTQLSADKIKAVIAELVDAEPIFNQAGFIMEELDMEVGLVPKLTPKFRRIHDIDQNGEDQILAALSERKLLRFLMISLFKTAKIRNMLEGSDMSLHMIEIDITAVPSVRSTFRRHAPAAESDSVSIVPDAQGEPTRH